MKHHDSTPDCHNFQRPIPQPHQPRISACLIVKDGAATLDRCLASIAPVVDEIIVVDTGSTDESVNIARRYTDKVFFYPWHDDFAAARNESLRHATGDWVMVIDADEQLLPDSYASIHAYINQYKSMFNNLYPIFNAQLQDGRRRNLFKRFLFPNHTQLRFVGCVHEILLSDELNVQNVLCYDLQLQHQTMTPVQNHQKSNYYHRLLEKQLAEVPYHSEIWGHTAKHLGDSYWSQRSWLQASWLYQRFMKWLKEKEEPQYNWKDPFVIDAKQRLQQIQTGFLKKWRKSAIVLSIGLVSGACTSLDTASVNAVSSRKTLNPVGANPGEYKLLSLYGDFCPGGDAALASACYSRGAGAVAGPRSINANGEMCVTYGGCSDGDPEGGNNGNEDNDSGDGEGTGGNIGSGCAPGKVKVKGKCVPEDEPLLYLDVGAAYFSPNGDGEQDSLSIQVKTNGDGAVIPWQVEVLHQGSSVWQTTGTGNQNLSWDGSGQSDGKVQIVLREQGKNKVHDRKNSAIDITPPEVEELNLSQNKEGKRQVKVRLKDPAVNGVRSGVIPDSVEVEMASDRFSLVSSQTDDKGPNAVLAMTLQENDFGIASFRIQGVNGNGYTLRAKDAAGNRVQKTLEECVASGELKKMRQQLAKTSQELQKLRDDIGEPMQLSSLSGGQGFGVAHVSGMPANHAGGFSILAVPLCDSNEPCTLFDRAEYVDRYGPGILTDHDRLRYNDLQKQIEFDNEQIEIYAGFALKTSAEMAVTFLTPLGAEVGVAYQVMAFSNYLKSAAPAVQAAIIARHHRAIYAALGAYTTFLNKLTQGLDELMASSAKGQFCAAGGPPLDPRHAKLSAHFMEQHSDNLAKNTGRSIQDVQRHIIGYNKKGELMIPGKNDLPASYYAKNDLQLVKGRLDIEVKPAATHEFYTGVELAEREWDVVMDTGVNSAPDLKMRPYGSTGEYQYWDLKKPQSGEWPVGSNQAKFEEFVNVNFSKSLKMYDDWKEKNPSHPKLMLVDFKDQPNVSPSDIQQMVINMKGARVRGYFHQYDQIVFISGKSQANSATYVQVKPRSDGSFDVRQLSRPQEIM